MMHLCVINYVELIRCFSNVKWQFINDANEMQPVEWQQQPIMERATN